MKYRVIIVMLVIVCSLTLTQAAFAQSTTTYVVDFDSTNELSYTIYRGNLTGSSGNPDNAVTRELITDTDFCGTALGDYTSAAWVKLTIPADTTITGIAYDVYTAYHGESTVGAQLCVLSNTSEVLYVDAPTFGVTHSVWNAYSRSVSLDYPDGGFLIIGPSNSQPTPYDSSVDHRIDNISITTVPCDCAAPPLVYKPIQESDTIDTIVPRYSGGPYDGFVSGASTITAMPSATSPIKDDVPVYSPMPATVTNVSYSSPYSITLEADYGDAVWRVELNGLKDVYVNEGDQVDGNCIIGVAGAYITPINTGSMSGAEVLKLRQITYSIYDETNSGYIDWTEHLDPSGSKICGSRLPNTSCLNNNPYFTNLADGWTLEPSTLPNSRISPRAVDGGVNVVSQSAISQYLTLGSGSYYVAIGVVLLDYQYGSIDVSLGDQTISEALYADLPGQSTFGTQVGEQQIIVVGPFDDPAPDLLPDTYKVKIKNNFVGHVIEITYACVSGETEAPISEVAACYFGALSDLDTTGTLKKDIVGTPYFELTDGDTISKDVTLQGYTADDAIYNVEVMANASALNAAETTATDGHLTLAFDDGVTDYAEVPDFAIPADVREFGMVTYRIVIPAGETVDTTLTVTYEPDDETDSEYMYVSSICLYPKSGLWPGKDPTPSGGGSSGGGIGGAGSGGGGSGAGPGSGLCTPAITPTGTDLWLWIAWLFSSISKLFTCVIPAQITRVVNAIQDIANWIGSLLRWFAGMFQLFGNWIFALMGWLINTALGMLATMLTTIWSAIASLPLIQGLLDQLSLAGIVFDLLLDLGNAIIAGLIYVMRLLMGLVHVIFLLWTNIIAGLNSATVTDTGIPVCSTVTADELFYPFCAFVTLFGHVIDLWPAAIAPLAVTVAAFCYMTAVTGISWVSKTLAEVG